MIVRVDQAWHDQSVAGVEDCLHAFAWEVASDDDVTAFDENVGERWFMNVAIVIVDLSASDQKPLGLPAIRASLGSFIAIRWSCDEPERLTSQCRGQLP
jgi:hypothetical protein